MKCLLLLLILFACWAHAEDSVPENTPRLSSETLSITPAQAERVKSAILHWMENSKEFSALKTASTDRDRLKKLPLQDIGVGHRWITFDLWSYSPVTQLCLGSILIPGRVAPNAVAFTLRYDPAKGEMTLVSVKKDHLYLHF